MTSQLKLKSISSSQPSSASYEHISCDNNWLWRHTLNININDIIYVHIHQYGYFLFICFLPHCKFTATQSRERIHHAICVFTYLQMTRHVCPSFAPPICPSVCISSHLSLDVPSLQSPYHLIQIWWVSSFGPGNFSFLILFRNTSSSPDCNYRWSYRSSAHESDLFPRLPFFCLSNYLLMVDIARCLQNGR